MSNRDRFIVVREFDGQRRYLADGTVHALWTEDRTHAKVWKLRAWAEQKATELGGEVYEVHRIEADPARLPREVLVAELEAAQARVAELEAVIASVRENATSTAKAYENEECSDVPDVCEYLLRLLGEGRRP